LRPANTVGAGYIFVTGNSCEQLCKWGNEL
jgi:hypothetical protein